MSGGLLAGAFNQALNLAATPISLPLQILGLAGGPSQGAPMSRIAGGNANAESAGSMLNFQKAQQTSAEQADERRTEAKPKPKPGLQFSKLIK